MTRQLLDHFEQNRYIDVLYSMSKRHLEAVRLNRQVTEKKVRWAVLGYLCVKVILVLVAIEVVFYAWVSLRAGP